ncbi:MAG: hypothetical protein V4492_08270 [Chlamydiota bacterium]
MASTSIQTASTAAVLQTEIPGPHSQRLQAASHYLTETILYPTIKQPLQKWFFENTTQTLCRGIDFSDRNVTLLITGYVQEDGLGDWALMLHAARVIQEKFPSFKIIIGAEVQGLSTRRDRFTSEEVTAFVWGVKDKRMGTVNFEDPDRDRIERDKCIEAASRATMVIELPHTSQNSSITFDSVAIPTVRIFESGAVAADLNTLLHMRESAAPFGLGVSTFESGLIWKAPLESDVELSSLEDEWLKNILLDSSREDHILHFGYLHYASVHFIAACIAADEHNPKGTIDIIVSDNFSNPEKIISAIQYLECFPEIKEIQAWKKDSIDKTTLYTSAIEKGISIRLINPFPIPNRDMHKLIVCSSGFIGCTGEVSLAEVLSYKRLPFYEVRGFKMPFLKSLTQIAREQKTNRFSPLVQYLELLERGAYQLIPEYVNDPALFEELNQFCTHLKKEYDFNTFLTDIVMTRLGMHFFPKLKEIRNDLLEAFLKNEKTLSECYQEIERYCDQFDFVNV